MATVKIAYTFKGKSKKTDYEINDRLSRAVNKIAYTFDAGDPDDGRFARRLLKSTDMALALFQITHNMRFEDMPDRFQKIIYEKVNDILAFYDILIDDLII